MSELELVIFDMAGTTVEDRGQEPSALIAALGEHGIPVTPDQVNSVRGAAKRQAILHFIPPGPQQAQQGAEVYASFRQHLTRLYTTEGVQPVAGAEGVFQWLRERGVRGALNTGFDRDT